MSHKDTQKAKQEQNDQLVTMQAGLIVVGEWFKKQGIWEKVEEGVEIRQKTRTHTPHEKLLDAFIHILSGAERLVTLNTGLRSQEGVQRAFGRNGCAEQSGVSTTLDRCDEESIVQMEAVLKEIYQEKSKGYRHAYEKQLQLLDVDMMGLNCGKQAEGGEKGYFSGKRGARGRQVGRVYATWYGETVTERLYGGSRQLQKELLSLVDAAEDVLGVGGEAESEKRRQTVFRVDAGGGSDDNLNGILSRGYRLIGKVHSWQRCRKLHRSVETWVQDPHDPRREVGWVITPHPYAQETRQLASRICRTVKGKEKKTVTVLVTDLTDEELTQIIPSNSSRHTKLDAIPAEHRALFLLSYAYDLRGGGVETSFREDKQALGLNKRNKQKFTAQQMLLCLTRLAHNVHRWLMKTITPLVPQWQSFGLKRFIRDCLAITALVRFAVSTSPQQPQPTTDDAQTNNRSFCLTSITFNQRHPASARWRSIISHLPDCDHLSVYLHKI